MARFDLVVVTIGQAGAETAARIAAHLEAPVQALSGDVPAALAAHYTAGQGIIGVCASGILIRALAPFLGSKWQDPPVLSVALDGSSAVPLLGGHHGANGLARELATVLGGHAALTTAGEAALGVALDAPPRGWRLSTPEAAKGAMARLLEGAQAELSAPVEWLSPLKAYVTGTSGDHEPVVLRVEGAEPLIYRRPHLSLGVGCARGCGGDELIGLVGRALAQDGLSAEDLTGIWSVDVKADEAAVHELGAHLNLPVRFFSAEQLETLTPRLANPSDVVFREVGCHGVAEAAALAAAGDQASLVLEKTKSANATCAVAHAAGMPLPDRPRGKLAVVGIGPGAAEFRTPQVSRLVAEADELVGYGLYIDLLGPLAAGKPRQDFPLGGEEARCAYALERAGEGKSVVLVCSGDGGIYAMGALVMELLSRPEGLSAAARRVEVVNAPGVSALQLASARAGALLGHDFCAISLSDLLTPREDVLQRLRGAAQGDFVIAFYNPVSKRRRTLLAEARDILLAHRPADTPVLLAKSLGRPEEELVERTLGSLEVDEVDMLTVVLVGASFSKGFRVGDRRAGVQGRHLFTPRGYANKEAS
ncbi:MAG: cobalamin biosynthesis protein [Pseudomonadota bacterium]